MLTNQLHLVPKVFLGEDIERAGLTFGGVDFDYYIARKNITQATLVSVAVLIDGVDVGEVFAMSDLDAFANKANHLLRTLNVAYGKLERFSTQETKLTSYLRETQEETASMILILLRYVTYLRLRYREHKDYIKNIAYLEEDFDVLICKLNEQLCAQELPHIKNALEAAFLKMKRHMTASKDMHNALIQMTKPSFLKEKSDLEN